MTILPKPVAAPGTRVAAAARKAAEERHGADRCRADQECTGRPRRRMAHAACLARRGPGDRAAAEAGDDRAVVSRARPQVSQGGQRDLEYPAVSRVGHHGDGGQHLEQSRMARHPHAGRRARFLVGGSKPSASTSRGVSFGGARRLGVSGVNRAGHRPRPGHDRSGSAPRPRTTPRRPQSPEPAEATRTPPSTGPRNEPS